MNKKIISMGFSEFLEDNVKEITNGMKWMQDRTMKLIKSLDELKEFVDRAIEAKICCVDLETTGLNTRTRNGAPIDRIVGICLSYDIKIGVYAPLNHVVEPELNLPEKEVLDEIKRLCTNCVTVYHNSKFDLQFLKNYGIIVKEHNKFEDTLILARLYDAGQKVIGLKELSESMLNQPMIEFTDIAKDAKRFDFVPPSVGYLYASSDAICTLQLFHFYMGQDIIKEQMSVYRLEKRVVPVVMEMEANLVKVDVPYLIKLRSDIEKRIKDIELNIHKLAGKEFNVASSQQLGKLLFDELRYEYPMKDRTKSGQYSTDNEVLEKIADQYPIVQSIIEFRELEKSKGTYIENLINNRDENDFLKFAFSQTGTDTGRFSSPGGRGINEDGYGKVNAQNLPSNYDPGVPDVRRALIARPGMKLVSIDYSGEELRVAANLSHESKWIDEFVNGDGDLHTKTGRILFGKQELTKLERNIAKCVAKGTLIASDRGWIPIENLTENDRVITHTGEFKKISKIHQMGEKPGVLITTTTGHRITCGENHRFLSDKDEWIKAINLKPEHIIKTVSCERMDPNTIQRFHFNIWDKGNNNFVSKDLPYIEISPLWARLLGYILGDGSVCVNWTADVKQDILETATKLGLTPKAYTYTYEEKRKDGTDRPQLHRIRIGSRVFIRFLREIGFTGRREWKNDTSPTKHKSVKIFRIPRVILESPKYISKEFLSGLFETDGTVSKNDVSVTTKDRDLAEDIVLLLLSFGIRSHITLKKSKKYDRDYFMVSFGRAGANIFESKIGFISKRKKEKLSILTSRKKINSSNVVWETQIKSIQLIKKIELMDLSVEDDHTYVAQGLITHNTFNFQILYGAGARGMAAQAKISENEAKRLLANFFAGLPQLKRWIDTEVKKAKKNKYVKTSFGRMRPLAKFFDTDDFAQIAHGERCVCNSEIQGACADIMKTAMVRIHGWIHNNNLQDDLKILLTIHDELIFEMPEEKMPIYIPKIIDIMRLTDILQGLLKWPVPLAMDCEYGNSLHVNDPKNGGGNYLKEHPEALEIKEHVNFHTSTQVTVSEPVSETPAPIPVTPPIVDPVSVIETSIPVPVIEVVPTIVTPDSTGFIDINSLLTNPELQKISSEDIPPQMIDTTVKFINQEISELSKAEVSIESTVVNLGPDSELKPLEKNDLTNQDTLIYTIRDRSKSSQRRLNHLLLFLLDEERDDKYQGPKKNIIIKDRDGNSLLVSEFKFSVDAFLALARFYGV